VRRTVALGLLGLVLAVAIGVGIHFVTRDTIALPVVRLDQRAQLAPTTATDRTPAGTTTGRTTAETETEDEPEDETETEDDSGSGSDNSGSGSDNSGSGSDDSGRGRGRGRGRGGDD
jgi:hypothetical protein